MSLLLTLISDIWFLGYVRMEFWALESLGSHFSVEMPLFSTKSMNILRVAIILAAKTKLKKSFFFLMYVFHEIASSLWK